MGLSANQSARGQQWDLSRMNCYNQTFYLSDKPLYSAVLQPIKPRTTAYILDMGGHSSN